MLVGTTLGLFAEVFTQDHGSIVLGVVGAVEQGHRALFAGSKNWRAGTVHVSGLHGYNPDDGDTFTIITFDDGVVDPTDLLGTFSLLGWSGFNPGVSFTALYFDHSVMLSATANAVPLPASAWLLATGSMSLVGWSRRRRRARRF